MGDHPRNAVIVMIRIMMEKEEVFHFGLECQCHNIIQTAMAPSDVFLVFVAIILRVHDEHIDTPQELDHFFVLFMRVFKGGRVSWR